MSARTAGVVVYRMRGGIDAIDEYSRRLVAALNAGGIAARYTAGGLPPVLGDSAEPPWVLLQYNPFSYGPRGLAPGLLHDVWRMRRRSRTRLAVMVHEAWIDMNDAPSTLIGLWQRAQLRALLRVADRVMTSTQALADELGGGAVHVPIASNITPVPTSPRAARSRLGIEGKLAVALFGRANPARALDYAEAAIAALVDALGADKLAILNLGADAPALKVPSGVEVHNSGRLPPDEVSVHLWASDLVLLPFTDGISTRRGTLMAALAHGRPVLGLDGRNTDMLLADAGGAVALTPVGDRSSFSRAAVELSGDPERLRAIGEAGRRLYDSRFDWAVTARSVGAVLETLSRGASNRQSEAPAANDRRRPHEVVFVAHDVGGAGGMERQSEQLVRRLVEGGHDVTVVARTCSLGERPGLGFVRVRTLRRPASLGYPAFFAVASLIVARLHGALLHTTGAIVANRADLSTVHYCHRAAASQVAGSRASRPSLPYRLNSAINGVMSHVGEAWCYRPGRTRLLCAVSEGVASELRAGFPRMAGAVRNVPNGVDSTVFRPDPVARREMRAKLGIDEDVRLALFVGGDWERKGLADAVDALSFAPEWTLAVAGAGDPTPHLARARGAQAESRLRFLGRVADMPRLYAAADAFVLPTAYEAFPLVTLEAAASGLPLLVTRVNGVEDLLEHGRNGWFIARDGRDIAQRLNELSSNPELARAMAAGARAASTAYSWETMADGYVSLYDELRASPTSS